MDGIGRRRRQHARDRAGLPDDAVPDGRAHRPARSRTAARERRRRRPGSSPTVDHDPALGVGGGQAPKALRHPGVELGPGALEAVKLTPPHAVGQLLGGDVEEHDEVGPAPIDGPLVDGPDLVQRQPSAVALVGERGVDAAVADHVPAGPERRADDLLDVLRPVGGDEERFGLVGHLAVGRIGQDRPHELADRRAAVLEGQHGVELDGQAPGVCRLPDPSLPSKAM